MTGDEPAPRESDAAVPADGEGRAESADSSASETVAPDAEEPSDERDGPTGAPTDVAETDREGARSCLDAALSSFDPADLPVGDEPETIAAVATKHPDVASRRAHGIVQALNDVFAAEQRSTQAEQTVATELTDAEHQLTRAVTAVAHTKAAREPVFEAVLPWLTDGRRKRLVAGLNAGEALLPALCIERLLEFGHALVPALADNHDIALTGSDLYDEIRAVAERIVDNVSRALASLDATDGHAVVDCLAALTDADRRPVVAYAPSLFNQLEASPERVREQPDSVTAITAAPFELYAAGDGLRPSEQGKIRSAASQGVQLLATVAATQPRTVAPHATAVARTVAQFPSALSGALPSLVRLYERTERDVLLTAVLEVVQRHPTALADHLAPIADRLDSRADTGVTRTVLGILRSVAEADPDAVSDCTDRLVASFEWIDDEQAMVALRTLSEVARVSPVAVEGHGDRIVAAAKRVDPQFRDSAVSELWLALDAAANSDPTATRAPNEQGSRRKPAVATSERRADRLGTKLSIAVSTHENQVTNHRYFQSLALRSLDELAEIADNHPRAVVEVLDPVTEALETFDHETVRLNALAILARMCKFDTATVTEYAATIGDSLSDGIHPGAVKNAAIVLNAITLAGCTATAAVALPAVAGAVEGDDKAAIRLLADVSVVVATNDREHFPTDDDAIAVLECIAEGIETDSEFLGRRAPKLTAAMDTHEQADGSPTVRAQLYATALAATLEQTTADRVLTRLLDIITTIADEWPIAVAQREECPIAVVEVIGVADQRTTTESEAVLEAGLRALCSITEPVTARRRLVHAIETLATVTAASSNPAIKRDGGQLVGRLATVRPEAVTSHRETLLEALSTTTDTDAVADMLVGVLLLATVDEAFVRQHLDALGRAFRDTDSEPIRSMLVETLRRYQRKHPSLSPLVLAILDSSLTGNRSLPVEESEVRRVETTLRALADGSKPPVGIGATADLLAQTGSKAPVRER